jgi:hypothetical protein
MISPEALSSLFAHAREVSAKAFVDNLEREAEARREFVTRVAKTQEELCRRVHETLDEKIRTAAAAGQRGVKILSFAGPEKFEWTPPDDADDTTTDARTVATDDDSGSATFSYLFLVKGPREYEAREDLVRDGVGTVLQTLRDDLAPFGVRHEWDQATNHNSVTVFW